MLEKILKNSKARLQKFYTFDLYSAQYWNIDIDIVKKKIKKDLHLYGKWNFMVTVFIINETRSSIYVNHKKWKKWKFYENIDFILGSVSSRLLWEP